MDVFGKRAYRCRGCRRRFYAPDHTQSEPPPAESDQAVDQQAVDHQASV
jgi:hypothetical protein